MRYITTFLTNFLARGATTSIPIHPIGSDVLKIGDNIAVYDSSSGQTISFVISADQSAADTSLTVDSVTLSLSIGNGAVVSIDYGNLIQEYQRKTEGTVAGFDIDRDGITKGGVEITGWLDSDTMTGATANNVPTAESVKAYVDASSGGTSNFGMLTCTGTTTTSSTNGEVNAVVIPFDTETATSTTNTIVLNGSGGVVGVSDTEYSFYLGEDSAAGTFEVNWNIGINTNIVNNRILVGMKLQVGTITGTTVTWVDNDPSYGYIYNRGAGSIRKGSGANSLFYALTASSQIKYFRLVFWKEEASNASMNAITLLNATQLTIKEL
tara:strand:+ start:529 stop:1500 length:972 start_codon:yes stop_codon:yes gene_type:complete